MLNIRHTLFSGCVFAILCCGLTLLTAACNKSPAAASAPARGRISIKTEPEGASIYVKGACQSQVTPCEMNSIKPGTYLMRIEKNGCLPRWVRVVVEPNRTTEIDLTLEAMTASVLITSDPTGAMVSMDGKELGPTPYILPNLKFGSYDVSVSMNNFKPVTQKLVVPLEGSSPDSPFEFKFTLLSDAGSLKVSSEPEGAEIYIDGARSPSLTPASFDRIQEGDHKLKIVKKGYRTIESTVTIVRDKLTDVPTFKLEELPGTFQLTVEPADAKVEIDGERVGDWSNERVMTPGTHSVRASKTGYDDAVLEFKIVPTEKTVEKLTLTRNTGEVRFLVNPSGVSISIDGILIGMSQPKDGNAEESETFRIAGLSMGEHTLKFMHPRAASSVTKKFRIKSKGETVGLEKTDLWVPNANVEVIKTKRIYNEGRIIPTGKDSDEVVYEPNPSVRDTYKKSEIRVTYLKNDPVSDPRFKTSFIDLLNLNAVPEKARPAASLRFNGLPAGSEIAVNGVSKGKVAENGAPFVVSDLDAGKYTIQISHKYGVNIRKPGSNSVKTTVTLNEGESKPFAAPPILWVANADLHLKNGSKMVRCKVVGETASHVMVETEPGKQVNVKKSEILKKIPLKD